jgi:hypothetical protein
VLESVLLSGSGSFSERPLTEIGSCGGHSHEKALAGH